MNKEYNRENFTKPENMDYREVIKPYQEAFSGPPWYEVSTCVDRELPQRCAGGLSSTAIGEICDRCGLTPLRPAYDTAELIGRFEQLAATRPTSWYTERVGGEVSMAAVAWKANALQIADEKYADVPEMKSWLTDSSYETIWLDEVFANKTVRDSGNLDNFGAMCRGFMAELGCGQIQFRTINEAMIRATKRDFGTQALVLRSATKETGEIGLCVPDRRDFVIITITEDES